MTAAADRSSGQRGARLRLAGPGDAAALLRLKQRLDRESSFMLFEPGERDASVDILAARLSETARSQNSAVIVAELDGDLGDEQDDGEDQARVLGPGQHRMPASPPLEPGAPAQPPGRALLEPAEIHQRPGQRAT